MTSDISHFDDGLSLINAEIASHEERLGLPKSDPRRSHDEAYLLNSWLMAQPTVALVPAHPDYAADFNFSDNLRAVVARIAFHEARLGQSRSEELDDIAQANLLLRELAAKPTPSAPVAAVAPAPTTTPPTKAAPVAPAAAVAASTMAKTVSSAPAVSGYRRTAQAFASSQSVAPLSPRAPIMRRAAAAPVDGKLYGAARLAAFYAQHAKTSPKA